MSGCPTGAWSSDGVGPTAAYGIGTSSSGFPDGTQARRLQISARYQW